MPSTTTSIAPNNEVIGCETEKVREVSKFMIYEVEKFPELASMILKNRPIYLLLLLVEISK